MGGRIVTFRRRTMVALLGMFGAALALLGVLSAPANADVSSPVPAATWGVNGRVSTILPFNGLVYIGGTFSAVTGTNGASYPASNLAVFDPSTGRFSTTWGGGTDGEVLSLATDGSNIFLGGSFNNVDGQPRAKLAEISPVDGSLNTTWTPTINRPALAVAVSGGNVYVGGAFTGLTDSTGTNYARSFLARFSASTGDYDQTWTPTPSAQVTTILPSTDGSHVFIGGDFKKVSGNGSVMHTASIFTSDGTIDTSFVPGKNNGSNNAPLLGLATNGSILLEAVAGPGGACTAYNASTGATLWSIHSNGDVQSVAIEGSTAYCGGHFSGTSSFGGQPRSKLASVDLASGTLQPMNPTINSSLGVWSLASDATHVYVGGDFNLINRVSANHFAMFVDPAAVTAPQPPTGLLAIGSDSAITLSWSPPSSDGGSPITQYVIYQVVNGTPTQIATSKQAMYTVKKLTNGNSYTYEVTAQNSAGQSDFSDPATGSPTSSAPTAPDAPTNVAASNVSDGVQVTWGAPANNGGSQITGYQVYRGTDPGALSLLATTTGTTLSYTDATGAPGVTYYYTVAATNSIGTGPQSSVASATLPTRAPDAPSGLTAQPNSGGGIALAWNAPASDGGSPVTKYIVVRDGLRYATVNAPTQTYVDTAVNSGDTHTYQLRAVNAIGSSGYSNSATATAP